MDPDEKEKNKTSTPIIDENYGEDKQDSRRQNQQAQSRIEGKFSYWLL